MNDTELRIIRFLDEHREGASGSVIAADCGVSVNTARKLIGQIREKLKEHGIGIEAKTSRGFRLIITDEETAKQFLSDVRNRINNPLFGKYTDREYKVHYIIRRLLLSGRRLSLEILSDELFYSASSMRREMKLAEEILSDYGLALSLKRGYGYAITGNEWGKRLCLLAEHKLFVNMDEGYQSLEPAFIELFGIGDEAVRCRRHQVRDAIFDSKILSFKAISVPVLMNYIPLIEGRSLFINDIDISKEQLAAIKRSAILPEAKRILSAAYRGFSLDEKEIMAYSMLLLSFRSVTDIAEIRKEEIKHLKSERDELIDRLENRISVDKIASDKDRDELLCLWYGIRNKLLFHVIPDDEDIREFTKPSSFAEDQCIVIAKYIEEKYNVYSPMKMMAAMYYVFLRLLIKCYAATNRYSVAVVSTHGYEYASFVAGIVKRYYAFYVKEADAFEYTQMSKERLKKYDIVLCDLKDTLFMDKDGVLNDKKLYFNTIMINTTAIPSLTHFFKNRENELREALVYEKELAADGVNDLLIKLTEFIDPSDAESFMDNLSDRLYYRGIQLKRDTIFLSAVVDDDKVGVYRFKLKKPIIYDGKKRSEAVVCFYNDRDFMKMYLMEKILLEYL